MLTRYHGESPAIQSLRRDPGLVALDADRAGLAASTEPGGPPFGHMFPYLVEDPENCLPEGPETIAALREIGAAIGADSSGSDGAIPAVYTYFGQFIDHDITATRLDPSIGVAGGADIIEAANFAPLSKQQIDTLISNGRTSPLDLDSVYEGAAIESTLPDGRMALSDVSVGPFGTIPTAGRGHDLPRRARIANPSTKEELQADREALIGDMRNDENLLVNQLHVAFLRAHNVLLDRLGDRDSARTELRRRYQWAVLNDFLVRIGEQETVRDVLDNGPRFFRISDSSDLFMPLEFSGAAYRFGHSMVRQEYEYNSTFNSAGPNQATFNFMFTFTALSGSIAPSAGGQGTDTLPDNWIIEWHRFFGPGPEHPSDNPARPIDARLAPELGRLPDFVGVPIGTLMGQLATRNLLRGYLLRLPTGQAVAREIGVQPLTGGQVEAAIPGGAQSDAAKAMFERTPLWLYVLAEAEQLQGGLRLGPVGTRIIAETLFVLASLAADSVVGTPPTEEELATGEFTLRGIVKLGQDPGMTSI